MFAGFSVTVLIVALEALPVLGSVTWMESVARSLTFWWAPRVRTSFWVWVPSLVSASSGATSKRRFLRPAMRRPPVGLRTEVPCQRDMTRRPTSRSYLGVAGPAWGAVPLAVHGGHGELGNDVLPVQAGHR